MPAATAIATSTPTATLLHEKVIDWFRDNLRDLPWRHKDTVTAWGVLVSEIMLQQTPVVRVQPVWEAWMRRWPTPAALAAAPVAEVLTAWGNLGYPRRALRLHETARALVDRHEGQVPADPEQLRALPGIGDYTAAAVSSFAFGIPETVVDTNIRRVHARAVTGVALPRKSLTAAEMRLAESLMPEDTDQANEWNAAVMELGALICTARSPKCDSCPVFAQCAWIAAGQPEPDYQPTGQAWAGTDRQLRGAIMAVLRAGSEQKDGIVLPELWDRVLSSGRLGDHRPDQQQWDRCVKGLVDDGLAVSLSEDHGNDTDADKEIRLRLP